MLSFLRSSWRAGAIILVAGGLLFLSLGGYLTPLFRTATNPLISVQTWFYTHFQGLYETIRSPQEMGALRQENVLLQAENSRLQAEVISLQEQLKDTDVLYSLLNFARSRPDDTYVAASVIGRDPSPFLRYVLINKGSDDGLLRGMPVVTAQGLAGKVDAVIANAARVQLINDPASAVNVKLKDSGADAMLNGSLTGDIILDMVSLDITLEPGDVVLTSALGGSYPPGILVGQVVSVHRQETDLFQSASVQPAVDYANLSAVLVVTRFVPVDTTPLISQN